MLNAAHDQDRRIVVGVDSSHGSKVALRWALAQARLTGASVEAVRSLAASAPLIRDEHAR